MRDKIIQNKVTVAIGIVWLFHITALIGISIGYQDWFVSKTSLNLFICLLLFFWVYPMDNLKKYAAFAIFFTGGMIAEWLGVNYGVLFGTYSYGNNFGPKLDGVPYLIGIYWGILTFISATLATYVASNALIKIILAAGLMVFLDFFMEHSAPIFDFWSFDGGSAPIENYTTWFAIAVIFQMILHFLRQEGNTRFSLHLYMAQLIFFGYGLLFLR
ncbi:carotenoid biosynthesis protein [Sediminicola sp. 1XM1-17]|uniref:carotenoid biosynthesis protein n=1 Tax=Sediminicola sp. 1XM1-17 TaxID=3127702 RepID=UPI003077B41C